MGAAVQTWGVAPVVARLVFVLPKEPDALPEECDEFFRAHQPQRHGGGGGSGGQ
ncbi:hypothetical protein AKJ09_00062 [Labilithrix luteola]|uniref:Uncharacterized protein n=1 Tax=Labilithrix luteola TaxID=1391654 RepID=A0A0K1PIM4_9BACT|nr:hypothetical protein AKJ09_00062 [Labilithrix luteola]